MLLASLFGALALALGLALVWALMAKGRERARADMLAFQLAQAEAKAQAVEGASAQMAEFLKAQAAQSANAVAEELLKRNAETMRGHEQLTHARLEAQLKPVAETLAKFEGQVAALEKSRAEETGGLKEQIAALMTASNATQAEARKLSSALRRGADALTGTIAVADPQVHRWTEIVGAMAAALHRRPMTVRIPAGLVRAGAAVTEAAGRLAGTAVPFNREKAEEMLAPAWTAELTGSADLLPPHEVTPLGNAMERTVEWYIRQGWL